MFHFVECGWTLTARLVILTHERMASASAANLTKEIPANENVCVSIPPSFSSNGQRRKSPKTLMTPAQSEYWIRIRSVFQTNLTSLRVGSAIYSASYRRVSPIIPNWIGKGQSICLFSVLRFSSLREKPER
jgi:PAS domain-containing protein